MGSKTFLATLAAAVFMPETTAIFGLSFGFTLLSFARSISRRTSIRRSSPPASSLAPAKDLPPTEQLELDQPESSVPALAGHQLEAVASEIIFTFSNALAECTTEDGAAGDLEAVAEGGLEGEGGEEEDRLEECTTEQELKCGGLTGMRMQQRSISGLGALSTSCWGQLLAQHHTPATSCASRQLLPPTANDHPPTPVAAVRTEAAASKAAPLLVSSYDGRFVEIVNGRCRQLAVESSYLDASCATAAHSRTSHAVWALRRQAAPAPLMLPCRVIRGQGLEQKHTNWTCYSEYTKGGVGKTLATRELPEKTSKELN